MSDFLTGLLTCGIGLTIGLVILFIIEAVNGSSMISDKGYYMLLLFVVNFIIIFSSLSFISSLTGEDEDSIVNDNNVSTSTVNDNYYHESIEYV